jgi:hypothetical protein
MLQCMRFQIIFYNANAWWSVGTRFDRSSLAEYDVRKGDSKEYKRAPLSTDSLSAVWKYLQIKEI